MDEKNVFPMMEGTFEIRRAVKNSSCRCPVLLLYIREHWQEFWPFFLSLLVLVLWDVATDENEFGCNLLPLVEGTG